MARDPRKEINYSDKYSDECRPSYAASQLPHFPLGFIVASNHSAAAQYPGLRPAPPFFPQPTITPVGPYFPQPTMPLGLARAIHPYFPQSTIAPLMGLACNNPYFPQPSHMAGRSPIMTTWPGAPPATIHVPPVPPVTVEMEIQPEKDKGRPVSSTPVPGTPWCVVWTGDSRSFFFNPSNKQSVWEKPAELVGRSDVAKMLESPTSAEEFKKKQQAKVRLVIW